MTSGLNGLQELAEPLQPAGGRVPIFMMGHSMGGLVTILTILRDQSAWQVGRLHSFSSLYKLDECESQHVLCLQRVCVYQPEYQCRSGPA